MINNAFVEQDDDQHQQHQPARVVHALDQEESDSDEMEQKHITDDDEGRERFIMNKTPSQDMFYKNGRMQSQDSLKQSRQKNRSEERASNKMQNNQQLKQNHSQSIKMSDADQTGQND